MTFISKRLANASPHFFSVYCITAAFGTYFCMYAFRKPISAGTFEAWTVWGVSYKPMLIASQMMGYMLSKFVGIKVVSEMPASRRAIGILVLIGIAEAALLLFAVTPPPWNFVWLFFNGLPLGMVFGLVLAFLEGRRVTEALAAGLSASMIISSGVVKSIGQTLIQQWGVSEFWMPVLTGAMFIGPLLLFVWMLNQIPKPSQEDIAHRSERTPMTSEQRRAFLGRHWLGVLFLIAIYVLLTIMRSIRDDFGIEIWRDLGYEGKPSIFAKSEMMVMFGVVLINGAAIWITSNRRAFLSSLGLVGFGFVIVLAAIVGHWQQQLSPLAFMVMTGMGLYIPYVAFHTTLFERLIAAFRERGNIGFLMYSADAIGYLGYVGIMLLRNTSVLEAGFLKLFVGASLLIAIAAIFITLFLVFHYYHRLPREESV